MFTNYSSIPKYHSSHTSILLRQLILMLLFFKWLYRFLLYLPPSIHLGSRSVPCTNCSLWVHLSCSGFSLAQFQKISPGDTWTCLKPPFQTFVSLSYSVSISSTLKKNTQKNPSTINSSAPMTSHLNVVVRSPSLHWGGSKWLVNYPRVSSSGVSPLDNSCHFLSLLFNAQSHMDSILKPN